MNFDSQLFCRNLENYGQDGFEEIVMSRQNIPALAPRPCLLFRFFRWLIGHGYDHAKGLTIIVDYYQNNRIAPDVQSINTIRKVFKDKIADTRYKELEGKLQNLTVRLTRDQSPLTTRIDEVNQRTRIQDDSNIIQNSGQQVIDITDDQDVLARISGGKDSIVNTAIMQELEGVQWQDLKEQFMPMFDRDQQLPPQQMCEKLQVGRKLLNYALVSKDANGPKYPASPYEISSMLPRAKGAYGDIFEAYYCFRSLLDTATRVKNGALQIAQDVAYTARYHGFFANPEYKNHLQLSRDQDTNILYDDKQVYLAIPVFKDKNHIIAAVYDPKAQEYVIFDNMKQTMPIIIQERDSYSPDNDFIKENFDEKVDAMQFALVVKKDAYDKIKGLDRWKTFSWKMPAWRDNNCYLAVAWLMAHYEKQVQECVKSTL